ncbi:hypothetical protein SpiGrapes_3079 [Sphaerochaeta pleomorpha str. Grapes]|uniref:Uncharacterized protein n=1 Tax=Sphaerochaeta pleomorpha (strain ATCC BAA-1885 / DSM 22778 / Grapes) TaxID=158190 RepID=G8QYW7_SPHPG|nr:hypothetical protein [Sphaerochaeta pleomorpha]AEV30826.1 hypothetical protein SpiGrapes_3079 [Sphaerochaeta pleomorpha str. Grapes]
MKRKVRIALSSLSLALILGSLMVFAVPHLLGRVVFFLDGPYAETQWEQTGKKTQWMLLRHGLSAQVIIVDPLPLDEQTLAKVASHKKTKAMVFSPLLTALEKGALPEDGQPLVIGMGMLAQKNSFFDIALLADADAGWSEAAVFLKERQAETHLGSAVLSQQGDERSTLAAKTFAASFSDASLVTVSQGKDEGGPLFAAALLDSLKKEHVMLVATAGADRLDAYFASDNSLQWVVDVRYKPIVPVRQLFAVVADDLSQSLLPLLPILDQRPEKRDNPLSLPLLRSCYPMTRTLGSFVESALQGLRRSLL